MNTVYDSYMVGQIKRGQLTFLIVTSERIYKIKWFLAGINHTLRGRSRRGQRRDPQYGAPNFRRCIVHLHVGDGTIPTVRKN